MHLFFPLPFLLVSLSLMLIHWLNLIFFVNIKHICQNISTVLSFKVRSPALKPGIGFMLNPPTHCHWKNRKESALSQPLALSNSNKFPNISLIAPLQNQGKTTKWSWVLWWLPHLKTDRKCVWVMSGGIWVYIIEPSTYECVCIYLCCWHYHLKVINIGVVWIFLRLGMLLMMQH